MGCLLSDMSVLHSFNFKVKNFPFLHQCIALIVLYKLILHFIILVGLILVSFSALWMLNLKIEMLLLKNN